MNTFTNLVVADSCVDDLDRVFSSESDSDVLPLYNDILFNDGTEHDNVEVSSTLNSEYIVEDDLYSFFSFSVYFPQSLNLVHLNCRSLKANFSEIESFVCNSRVKFTAIALSETWLHCNNENIFNL